MGTITTSFLGKNVTFKGEFDKNKADGKGMVEFGDKQMYGQFEKNYKHGKIEVVIKKNGEMENKYTANFKKNIEIKGSVEFLKR